MQRLLQFLFIFIFIFNGSKKLSEQCNHFIFGEDTIFSGRSSYLFVNDIFLNYYLSNGSTVSYTYATAPGTITLNTIDSNSCHGTRSIIIRQVQPPSVSFSVAAAGYNATLTNTSSNTYSYRWYFGDGTTSTSVNPSHL